MIRNATTIEVIFPSSIIKVKEAISRILKTSSYSLLKNDDHLNDYRFYIYIGDISGLISVKLNELEKNKTQCCFEITNNEGMTVPPEALGNLQNTFLRTLSDLLSGKIIIKKKWKNDAYREYNSKTYLVFFVILIIASSLLIKHYLL